TAIAAIAAEQEGARHREHLTRLDGLDAVRERLAELTPTVQHECLSFSPGAAHKPDAMAASKPLNQILLERGVALRCVYQESFRNDAATLAYAQWLTGLGAQTRTVPVVPMQMIIVDKRLALIPLYPDDSSVGAIEVNNSAMLVPLLTLFDQVWR